MKTYLRIFITAASLLLGMALMPQISHAAVDMFLHIEGIPGESKDSVHAEEIDVLAWSWGMTQSGSLHSGGGGGAGKVNIRDLLIHKYIDSASARLMLAAATGQPIPEATLTIRNAGGEQLEYLIIFMEDLLISSIATGGSGGEDRLTETITLNFAKVKVTYTPQSEQGGGEAPIEFGWDIPANVPAP